MDKCWLPSVTFWPLGSLLVVVKSNTAGSGWPNLLYVFLCTFGPLRGPTEPRVGHKRLNAQCCSTVAVESVLCALCVVTQGEDMLHGWCMCGCDHLHLLSCTRKERHCTPCLGSMLPCVPRQSSYPFPSPPFPPFVPILLSPPLSSLLASYMQSKSIVCTHTVHSYMYVSCIKFPDRIHQIL